MTLSPPLNGGIFGATVLYTGTAVRWPTRFVSISGEPGRNVLSDRKWNLNPCPRRPQIWWYHLLSYRGKTSIDYPAQGIPCKTLSKPYNNTVLMPTSENDVGTHCPTQVFNMVPQKRSTRRKWCACTLNANLACTCFRLRRTRFKLPDTMRKPLTLTTPTFCFLLDCM